MVIKNSMDKNFLKGLLKRWNEDKGFGFVQPEHGKKDVFIHISAFKRLMSRRPIVGDVIIYQIHTDNDGKKRAVNAKIEGVSELKPKVRQKSVKHKESHKGLLNIFLIISFMLFAFFIYNAVTDSKTVSKGVGAVKVRSNVPLKQKRTINYSCQGKVYCSQMVSCEEAKFYLKYCPDTRMDGDGVPCESQWCHW